MKLFYKRPLCLILCIMLGGFCFSVNAKQTLSIAIASVSLGFLISIFVFKNIIPSRIIFTRICIILFIIAILLGMLFNYTFFPDEHYGKEVQIEGVIVDADHTSASYSLVTVKTVKINEKRDTHRLSVIASKDTISGLNVGDKITAKITITSIREDEYKSFYISNGISAAVDEINEITVNERNTKTIGAIFSSMRLKVCDRLRNLTNKRTGDFLSALLTGERSAVDPAISLSFSRTGTTHILALSGAHLVILSYALSLVLKSLGLRKRIGTIVTAVAVTFYVPFTGMSSSVTRAGVMLLISSLIFLVERRSDGPTTLMLSVFLIVLAQPFAIYDISLWLSALATLGLILLSSLLKRRGKRERLPRRMWKAFVTASLASVFAISASFIISLLFFDGFSTLALPATLVISILTEALMYISLLALICGRIIPLGKLLISLSNLTFEVADWLSSFEYAYITFDFVLIKIIAIILIVAFMYLLLFSTKNHRRLSILVLTVIFLALNTVGIAQSAIVKNQDGVIFYSDERCNVITVRSDGEYSVIASGGGNGKDFVAVNAAGIDKITAIDQLIIPSYTYYSNDFILSTVSKIRVVKLMLPAPITYDEFERASFITELIKDFDTEIAYFYDGDEISLGKAYFKSVSHSQAASQRLYNSFTVSMGDDLLLYISADAVIDSYVATRDVIGLATTVIVGGTRHAEQKVISLMPTCAKKIILGGGFTLSNESLKFAKEKGASVIYADTPTKIN